MKALYKYIKESAEDGKNGHWEDFVDEDTGEIVTMWVNDPTPEDIAAKEKEREENTHSYYEQQLKDLNREYRDLRMDMEEELGQLYSSGKEAEAEKLAQKYGKQENRITKEQESLRKKLASAKKKRDIASSKFWKFYDKLWDTK